MKAIVTVIGRDRVGIIAEVSAVLAQRGVNVVDLSQTVMQEYFTMIMLVELPEDALRFDGLSRELKEFGAGKGLVIRIQREDIFNAMHRI